MKKHKKKKPAHIAKQANSEKKEVTLDNGFVISNESSEEEIQAFLEARNKSKKEEEMKQMEARRIAEEERKRQEELARKLQMETARKRLENQRAKDEEDKKISNQESIVKQFSINAESSDEEIHAFMEAKHKLNEIKESVMESRRIREKSQHNEDDNFLMLKEKIAEDNPDYDVESIDKNFLMDLINKKRNVVFVFSFLLIVLASYGVSYWKKSLIQNEIILKEKTEKYIKENLVQPGTDLKIAEFAKEGDLYKFTVEFSGQSVVSYLTGDGKKLLLNPVDLDGQTNGGTSQAKAPVAEASTKKDVPEVELFVMSYCPYGVQAEKGILPVVEKLKSKINFSIKFVDYTLHGKKEFDENLNQYCIQKEEPEKFNDYLTCFAKDGDAAKCAIQAKISKEKNTSCISVTDKEFKLTENFSASAQSSPFNIHKDLNDKYGVQGSPSLVVNGQLLDAGRDSASLLKTVCSGFVNQPEECKAALSSASPTPGFGN